VGGLGDGDVIPYMMGMALVGANELGMLVEACWRYKLVGRSVQAPCPHAEAQAEALRRGFYGYYCGYYRNMVGYVRVTVVRMAIIAP